MKDKTLMTLVTIMVASIAVLLIVNSISFFAPSRPEKYVDLKNVKGMEIYHKSLPYTLNFEQQNKILDILNMSLPVKKDAYPSDDKKWEFSKLVVYRFKEPDIEIIPVATARDNNLVFDIHEWESDNYLMEQSGGKLKELLSQTYDK